LFLCLPLGFLCLPLGSFRGFKPLFECFYLGIFGVDFFHGGRQCPLGTRHTVAIRFVFRFALVMNGNAALVTVYNTLHELHMAGSTLPSSLAIHFSSQITQLLIPGYPDVPEPFYPLVANHHFV
jgi:hypothetical protein